MQPENSQRPGQGVEQAPIVPNVGPEAIPSLPPVEAGPLGGQERFEQAAEAGARVSDAASAASQVATPAAPQPVQAHPQQNGAITSDTPLVAADEDVIEKEWVDKAKAIIQQTKDDPYKRTQQVNALQRDYLQKRYGKVVGATE